MTNIPESETQAESTQSENAESFQEILSEYEQSHTRKAEGGRKQIVGTVIAVSDDSVFLDIGYKIEGVLPLAAFQAADETVRPGDTLPVTIKGRNEEGYYELSRLNERRPTDWDSLQQAFNDKAAIAGTVTAVVKGGFSVDVGVRAFMPASRSGVRDSAEMEKLVGQEILCRITKLDVTDEDVVVDRRVIAEEEERAGRERRYAQIREGDTVQGTVRNLTDYGAFVDVGGVDGLLHVADISWTRVNKPSDVLSVGQQIEAKVLKFDPDKRRISLGLKQLQAHPWDVAAGKYNTGDRVRGTVTRVLDFGAFVELEPGVEGLIHISELSWSKRVKHPSDIVKSGETVDAMVLAVSPAERRISLGLKQALGDPWADAAQRFPAGSVIEGPVTSLTDFGAFVQLTDGLEGMIHISDLLAEKRVKHPKEVVNVGQVVKAQVLEVDPVKRRMRLGMKQLVPTSLDEYIAEHKPGDVVTGRIVELSKGQASVELGEGIRATCRVIQQTAKEEARKESKPDLSSLTSMLAARWKGGAAVTGPSKPEPLRADQIRSFRITALDGEAKKIELEPA